MPVLKSNGVSTTRIIDPDAQWGGNPPLGVTAGDEWIDTSSPVEHISKYWTGERWVSWAIFSRKDLDSFFGFVIVYNNSEIPVDALSRDTDGTPYYKFTELNLIPIQIDSDGVPYVDV